MSLYKTEIEKYRFIKSILPCTIDKLALTDLLVYVDKKNYQAVLRLQDLYLDHPDIRGNIYNDHALSNAINGQTEYSIKIADEFMKIYNYITENNEQVNNGIDILKNYITNVIKSYEKLPAIYKKNIEINFNEEIQYYLYGQNIIRQELIKKINLKASNDKYITYLDIAKVISELEKERDYIFIISNIRCDEDIVTISVVI